MQVDYGKFILKQLDYSLRPSFSTSNSQLVLLVENKAIVNSVSFAMVNSAASRWLSPRRKLGLAVSFLIRKESWENMHPDLLKMVFL